MSSSTMGRTAKGEVEYLADMEHLFAAIEVNAAVYNDPDLGVEERLLNALAAPLPANLHAPLGAQPITMLVFLNADVRPQDAFLAIRLRHHRATRTRACEHCGSRIGGKHRLLVPFLPGAIVAYHCCPTCRRDLDAACGEMFWD